MIKKSNLKIQKKGGLSVVIATDRKLDLNMILGLDKYWKASPGSTLKGFNIGLTVFKDFDEFMTKFEPMANLLK